MMKAAHEDVEHRANALDQMAEAFAAIGLKAPAISEASWLLRAMSLRLKEAEDRVKELEQTRAN